MKRPQQGVVMDETTAGVIRGASGGGILAFSDTGGDDASAWGSIRSLFGLAMMASDRLADVDSLRGRLDSLRAAARLALEAGDANEARRLIDAALAVDDSPDGVKEWTRLRDVTGWPDPWLVAAVRRDPPDEASLDALVDRYWKDLFARCRLLTMNPDKAADLAQEAWCRVLKARRALKPEGNFPAYLSTVATNLWRDLHRLARRAGPMGEHRLSSLDSVLPVGEGETVYLKDAVPDLNSLEGERRRLLRLEIDQALGRLSPHLREVVVARYFIGESCAEIGLRHGRTEQTVSGWVRQGIRELKVYLEESPRPS
jgi:RNA polymerase sigma factor (sigma-70 family)